jgi:hypothetical protein
MVLTNMQVSAASGLIGASGHAPRHPTDSEAAPAFAPTDAMVSINTIVQ